MSLPLVLSSLVQTKSHPSVLQTIMAFPNDKLEIPDDFPVECGGLAAALTEST
jgi:hypothetical protein